MDLLDRYLGAVAALLPAAQRDDIVAELRDLVLNRIEEKEATLGRALSKKETEDLLREIGHPLAVAGRYGPQRSLIGPEIYPFYIFGLKVALALAAFVTVIPLLVVMATGELDASRLISRSINDFIPTALILIGAATLIAAAFERGWIKTGDLGKWRVADLPVLPPRKTMFSKTRFEALFELAAVVLFVLWWTGAVTFPIHPTLEGGDGRLSWTLAPVLMSLWWPILGLAVLQAISSLILVIWPGAVRPRAAVEILGAVSGLALAALLWPAQPLIVFSSPDLAYDSLANLQRTVDLTFKAVLIVAVIIAGSKLLIEGWRLIRGPRVWG